MGLDVMELMMAVEEHFGITLPDERAERIFTVGDLYRYILGRTRRGAVPSPCPTGQAFYRLRRTLTADFGLERGRIRPAARLRDLFPRASRAATWLRLTATLGVGELPDPEPRRKRRQPSARAFGITLAAVTAAVWLVYPVLLFLPGWQPIEWSLALSFLAAFEVCLIFAIWWVSIRLERILDPLPPPRLRDLAVRIAAWPREQYPVADAADPAAAAVWTDLTAILSRQTGVPAAEIRPEERWDQLWR